MPRPSHYNRQFLIYLPTEKDLDNWKELAKAARISLNVDPKDSEAVRIVHRRLQILQDFKLIMESANGWRWVE